MARMHLQQRRLQDVSDLHDEAGMWSMTVVVTMDLVLHSLQLSALSARSYLLSKVPHLPAVRRDLFLLPGQYSN